MKTAIKAIDLQYRFNARRQNRPLGSQRSRLKLRYRRLLTDACASHYARCRLCNVRLIDIAKGQFDSNRLRVVVIVVVVSAGRRRRGLFPRGEYRLFSRISASGPSATPRGAFNSRQTRRRRTCPPLRPDISFIERKSAARPKATRARVVTRLSNFTLHFCARCFTRAAPPPENRSRSKES